MSVLFSRVTQAGRFVWWGLALVLVAALALVWYLLRRRLPKPNEIKTDALTAAVRGTVDRIAAANAQASVEVAVARTQDKGVQIALEAALAEPDGKKRRRDLIALRKRVEAQP